MQTKNYNSLATSENKVVKLSEETCEKNTQKSVWQTEYRFLMSIYVYLQVSSQKQLFTTFVSQVLHQQLISDWLRNVSRQTVMFLIGWTISVGLPSLLVSWCCLYQENYLEVKLPMKIFLVYTLLLLSVYTSINWKEWCYIFIK